MSSTFSQDCLEGNHGDCTAPKDCTCICHKGVIHNDKAASESLCDHPNISWNHSPDGDYEQCIICNAIITKNVIQEAVINELTKLKREVATDPQLKKFIGYRLQELSQREGTK